MLHPRNKGKAGFILHHHLPIKATSFCSYGGPVVEMFDCSDSRGNMG